MCNVETAEHKMHLSKNVTKVRQFVKKERAHPVPEYRKGQKMLTAKKVLTKMCTYTRIQTCCIDKKSDRHDEHPPTHSCSLASHIFTWDLFSHTHTHTHFSDVCVSLCVHASIKEIPRQRRKCFPFTLFLSSSISG